MFKSQQHSSSQQGFTQTLKALFWLDLKARAGRRQPQQSEVNDSKYSMIDFLEEVALLQAHQDSTQ
ncbi:MAG: hypothetical protein ACFB4I_15705 [Cyanophyceae cyanobacterium]